MTVADPVVGAYYTVFTTTDLREEFAAESVSVLCEEGAPLVLKVDADTPSKFAKVVVSHGPIAAGTKISAIQVE